MLKIIIFSLLFGFLATWFSSPRFLRHYLTLDKDKKIVFRDLDSFKRPFMTYSWKHSQKIAFIVTTFCSFLFLLSAGRGTSLFSGGILGSFITACFWRFVYKPSDDITIKKVLFFWKASFWIYLLLFAIDNIQFRLADVPEYEIVESLEVHSEGEFEMSLEVRPEGEFEMSLEVRPEGEFEMSVKSSDFIRNCTIQKIFHVDGKYIAYAGSNCVLFVVQNKSIIPISYPRIASNATFSPICIPLDLRDKNIRGIGVTVDDEYQPYFVYALLKQEPFFGKYSVDKFILQNPFDKENLQYYDELPDFAKP